MSKNTLTITLTGNARGLLWGLCNNKEGGYGTDVLLDAGSLVKKLREGAEEQFITFVDKNGNKKEQKVYTNFQEGELELTPEEYRIAKEQFMMKTNWSPEEESITIYTELKNTLT